MRKILIAAAVLFVSFSTAFAGADYTHNVQTGTMSFEWTIDGKNLNVRLTAETDSWVGIGFNPSSAMQDANFILGYVKNGKVSVTDEFGTSRYQHKEDTKIGGSSDVSNESGEEAGGKTVISFTIPMNSGDDKDQVLSADGDTVVLLAHGKGRDSFKSKHSFRTTLKVNLGTGASSNL